MTENVFVNARPLDDDDVNNEKELYNRLNKVQYNAINDIFDDNLKIINTLLATIGSQAVNDSERADIDRLKLLVRTIDASESFIRMKDKLYDARVILMKKDMDFFMKKDYKSFVKQDQKKAFIENLLQMIKYKVMALDEEERDIYWNYIFKMLNNIVQYELIMINVR